MCMMIAAGAVAGKFDVLGKFPTLHYIRCCGLYRLTRDNNDRRTRRQARLEDAPARWSSPMVPSLLP